MESKKFSTLLRERINPKTGELEYKNIHFQFSGGICVESKTDKRYAPYKRRRTDEK